MLDFTTDSLPCNKTLSIVGPSMSRITTSTANELEPDFTAFNKYLEAVNSNDTRSHEFGIEKAVLYFYLTSNEKFRRTVSRYRCATLRRVFRLLLLPFMYAYNCEFAAKWKVRCKRTSQHAPISINMMFERSAQAWYRTDTNVRLDSPRICTEPFKSFQDRMNQHPKTSSHWQVNKRTTGVASRLPSVSGSTALLSVDSSPAAGSRWRSASTLRHLKFTGKTLNQSSILLSTWFKTCSNTKHCWQKTVLNEL